MFLVNEGNHHHSFHHNPHSHDNHLDWDNWHSHILDDEYDDEEEYDDEYNYEEEKSNFERYSYPEYNIYWDGKSEPIRTMDDSKILSNFKKSAKYLKNVEFIAYGRDSFNAKMNTTWEYKPENGWTKPWGGVWASPINASYGWAEYLDGDNFGSRIRDLSKHFRFKLAKGAKIYTIDNKQDLINVSTYLGSYEDYESKWFIDFPKLCNDYGCDGVFVTDKAVKELRCNIYLDRLNIIQSLFTWDVCSIWIANLDIIEPLNENAFEKASFPKKGLNIDDDMLDDMYYDPSDRYWLQMQSDYEKYGNQNIRNNMCDLFNGQHPAILAQGHGNSKSTKLARNFNGTIKSGM